MSNNARLFLRPGVAEKFYCQDFVDQGISRAFGCQDTSGTVLVLENSSVAQLRYNLAVRNV